MKQISSDNFHEGVGAIEVNAQDVIVIARILYKHSAFLKEEFSKRVRRRAQVSRDCRPSISATAKQISGRKTAKT